MEIKTDETAKAIVPILACVLNQLCSRNDRLPVDPKMVSKFHALRPPAIGVADYLERIAKYAACSGECFVLALIYIDRIIQTNPHFVVNSLNIHRLLVTSVMLGAKFFDDQYFNNAYYAKVGGVPPLEVDSLEVEFLFMTNFTLFVTTEQYTQYYTELHNHVLHSNCACSRKGIRVPPLRIPDVVQTKGEASDVPVPPDDLGGVTPKATGGLGISAALAAAADKQAAAAAAAAGGGENAIDREIEDADASDEYVEAMATDDSPVVYSSSPPVQAH